MIIDILNQILSARYGRDVRQAIHDGIQQCYNDGKAGSIDLEARQGIQALESEIAELQKFEVITETTSTTQPNSYAGRENILEIGGVTEQDSTAGNQLFDASKITKGKYVDDNGTIQNGASTYCISEYIPISTDVVLSGKRSLSGYNIGIYNSAKNFVARVGVIDTESDVKIPYASGYAYIVLTLATADVGNMMLNKGTTALPYEPYTGGIPAPNPSYPMEIKKSVVSGVRTHRNQLFDASTVSAGMGISTTSGNLYADATMFSTNYIDVSNIASISWNGKSSQSSTWGAFYDANKSFIGAINKNGTSTFTIDIPSGASYVRLSFLNEYLNTAMVNAGTTVLPYEPYTESSHTFSQPIDLYGMNGVQDIFTAKQTKRRFVKRIFDGSEGWFKENNYFRLKVAELKSGVEAICDTFIYTKAYNTMNSTSGMFYIGEGSIRFNATEIFSTVDEWKAHLAEKPMEVVYGLAEEVTEELPIADQIGLNSLQTYDGITYVEFDSEVQPTLKAEYGTSKVGGYTLESLLTARNNALK